MKNTCKGGLQKMKNLKKWLCMLLFLLVVGGYGLLGSNGIPEDDPDDWNQVAEDYEELWRNI